MTLLASIGLRNVMLKSTVLAVMESTVRVGVINTFVRFVEFPVPRSSPNQLYDTPSILTNPCHPRIASVCPIRKVISHDEDWLQTL